MRINGHTRLDLYSSCTAVQVTLKNSHSYTGSPLKKLKFQLTYLPGLYRLAVWTKTQLSGWESMDIPDLTCTVLVRPEYRSSLVCPLIHIRRAAFWSKRLVCTVLGSMLTGIWVFSMEILYSYVNSSRSPVRPYKNCTGQVWYVHWFSSGELRFGPNG